jgi:hypothetical protein
MKPESWRTDKKYDRGRPKSTITSWAASILVFGYLVAFAKVSAGIMEGHVIGYFLGAVVMAGCGLLLTHLFR